MRVLDWLDSEYNRATLYRLVVALLPLLVAGGLLAPDEAARWLELATAVLGLGTAGLAVANTSRKKPDGQ